MSGEDKEEVLMHPHTPDGGGQQVSKVKGRKCDGEQWKRRNGRRGKGEWTNVGQRKQKHRISDKKKSKMCLEMSKMFLNLVLWGL